MKRLFITVTLSFLLITGTTVFSHDDASHKFRKIHHKYAPRVNWKSLEEGLSLSETLKKPLLVDFGVEEGCHRCAFMQKNIYGDDEILEKINTDFLPVFIDLSKPLSSREVALGEKYDFKHDCLLLFLNHKGEVIHNPEGMEMCFAGKIEPEVFIDYLEYIIKMYNQNI